MPEQHKFRDGDFIFNIPLICSDGGIPYNKKHIDYWQERSSEYVAEIVRLRKRVADLEAMYVNLETD